MARFKEKFYSFMEYLFVNEVVKEKSPGFDLAIAIFYLFLHFIVGFFVLWSTYDFVSQLDDYETSYKFKSAFETIYLLFGVIWGNVGWDSYTKIKEGATRQEIGAKLFKFTIPVVCVVAITMTLFIPYIAMKELDLPILQWLSMYYNRVSATLTVTFLIILLYICFIPIGKLKRKFKKGQEHTQPKEKSEEQASPEVTSPIEQAETKH